MSAMFTLTYLNRINRDVMSMSQAAMQFCCFGLLKNAFLYAFKLKASIINYELLCLIKKCRR